MTIPYTRPEVRVTGTETIRHPETGKPGLRVIETDPTSDTRWDSLVAAHPDGLVYHSAAYLQALTQEYRSNAVFLACEDSGGQIRGILPLFHTRGLPLCRGGIFGRRLTSLPRTPVAGPLALDREAMSTLLREAKERTGREKGAVLQLKVPTSSQNDAFDGLVGIPWRKTYVLELPDRPEMLRFGNSRNHTRIKQRVAKASKLGVTVRRAESEDELRSWYELYLETMRWHAVPPRPYRLFSGFWKYLRPDKMCLLLAYQDKGNNSKLLAGSIFLMCGRTVFYAFNGRRNDDLAKLPNYAILWQAIFDACREGFRYFDLGEVTRENLGLAEFKAKWAGKPKWLVRYYSPSIQMSESRESVWKGAVTSSLEAVWRRLPLKVTAIVGNAVYGFL